MLGGLKQFAVVEASMTESSSGRQQGRGCGGAPGGGADQKPYIGCTWRFMVLNDPTMALITYENHVRALKGHRYTYSWVISTMNLQVPLNPKP